MCLPAGDICDTCHDLYICIKAHRYQPINVIQRFRHRYQCLSTGVGETTSNVGELVVGELTRWRLAFRMHGVIKSMLVAI